MYLKRDTFMSLCFMKVFPDRWKLVLWRKSTTTRFQSLTLFPLRPPGVLRLGALRRRQPGVLHDPGTHLSDELVVMTTASPEEEEEKKNGKKKENQTCRPGRGGRDKTTHLKNTCTNVRTHAKIRKSGRRTLTILPEDDKRPCADV